MMEVSGTVPEEVQEILDREGNGVCGDCGHTQAKWASVDLGVVLCIDCGGMHRMLGTHLSKVRSLELDRLLPEHVATLDGIGNAKAKAKWEHSVPSTYRRGWPRAPPAIREQWIRAKYERQEFISGADNPTTKAALSGAKSGMLSKKGKAKLKWADRMFRLNADGLAYFAADKDYPTNPKRLLPFAETRLCFSSVLGARNSFQIVQAKPRTSATPAPPKEAYRVFYVAAESSADMYSWVNAFRAAKARSLGYEPSMEQSADLDVFLNEGYEHDGFLKKQSPRETGFKERWFALLDGCLLYFRRPTDAFPVGYIPLGSESEGFCVQRSGVQPSGCCFSLVTPFRTYLLQGDDEETVRSWIEVLTKVMNPRFAAGNHRNSTLPLPMPMQRPVSHHPHDEGEEGDGAEDSDADADDLAFSDDASTVCDSSPTRAAAATASTSSPPNHAYENVKF